MFAVDAVTEAVIQVIFLCRVYVIISVLRVLEARHGSQKVPAVVEHEKPRFVVAFERVFQPFPDGYEAVFPASRRLVGVSPVDAVFRKTPGNRVEQR